MTKFLIAVLFVPSLVMAESLWVRDCVRWWGGDIPQAERTKENCPRGKNHWDTSSTVNNTSSRLEYGNSMTVVNTASTTVTNTATSNSGITTYNLPSGSYQVNRVGNTVTVIQTSKGR